MIRTQLKRPEYVEQIGWNFRDLPWADRQTLLDDVSAHLSDEGLAPDDLEPWIERFGPPVDYARQLRDDLGLGTDGASLQRGRRPHLQYARLRAKISGAVALVAVCGIVAAAVWVSNYHPLRFGDIISQGGESISAGGATEYRWQWGRDREFEIGTYLRNDGPVAVRVTGLPLPNLVLPWKNWRVTLSDNNDHIGRTDRPFSPFTLQPGDGQLIWFRGDLVQCPENYTGGSGLGVSTVDVTFDVLGIKRRETLALGFTYSVKVDPICPNPSVRG